MSFYKYVHKHSKRGLGKTILFALLLAFIFSLSVLGVITKGFYQIKSEGLDQYNELNCVITDYELSCDEDYFREDDFIIDLNYEDDSELYGDVLILTKDRAITEDGSFTYEEILEFIEHDESSFTVNDLEERIVPWFTIIVLVVFISTLIGMFIWYLLMNMLLALVMKVWINKVMVTNYNFEQMYKMVMIAVLPYVVFNAICRVIFEGVPTDYIASFMPYGGWIIRLLLDYAIVYGIMYLVISRGKEEIETIGNKSGE